MTRRQHKHSLHTDTLKGEARIQHTEGHSLLYRSSVGQSSTFIIRERGKKKNKSGRGSVVQMAPSHQRRQSRPNIINSKMMYLQNGGFSPRNRCPQSTGTRSGSLRTIHPITFTMSCSMYNLYIDTSHSSYTFSFTLTLHSATGSSSPHSHVQTGPPIAASIHSFIHCTFSPKSWLTPSSAATPWGAASSHGRSATIWRQTPWGTTRI